MIVADVLLLRWRVEGWGGVVIRCVLERG